MSNLIDVIQPEIVMFGHVRAHIEIAKDLSNVKHKILVAHGKETFFDVNDNISEGGSHKGYSNKELPHYLDTIKNHITKIISVSKYTANNFKKQNITTSTYVLNPKVKLQTTNVKSLPNKTFKFLTVGRLIKRKGHLDTIKLLEKLDLSYDYTIIGDGPEYSEIKSFIDLKKLNNKIELKGQAEKLDNFYQNSDAFIMLSNINDTTDVEGFGIVYLEAKSWALPCIAWKNGGPPEAVKDKVDGYVISSMSEGVSKLRSLMTSDSLYYNFSKNAIIDIKERNECNHKISDILR